MKREFMNRFVFNRFIEMNCSKEPFRGNDLDIPSLTQKWIDLVKTFLGLRGAHDAQKVLSAH